VIDAYGVGVEVDGDGEVGAGAEAGAGDEVGAGAWAGAGVGVGAEVEAGVGDGLAGGVAAGGLTWIQYAVRRASRPARMRTPGFTASTLVAPPGW
jgi:hypothetical protein